MLLVNDMHQDSCDRNSLIILLFTGMETSHYREANPCWYTGPAWSAKSCWPCPDWWLPSLYSGLSCGSTHPFNPFVLLLLKKKKRYRQCFCILATKGILVIYFSFSRSLFGVLGMFWLLLLIILLFVRTVSRNQQNTRDVSGNRPSSIRRWFNCLLHVLCYLMMLLLPWNTRNFWLASVRACVCVLVAFLNCEFNTSDLRQRLVCNCLSQKRAWLTKYLFITESSVCASLCILVSCKVSYCVTCFFFILLVRDECLCSKGENA